MERGSVPSSTLLSGSTTELEDDEDVEEELPFRLTFLVFDSVTCGRNPRGQVQVSQDFSQRNIHICFRSFPSSKGALLGAGRLTFCAKWT